MRGKEYVIYALLLLALAVILNLPAPVSLRMKAGMRDGVAPFQNVMSLTVRKAAEALSSLSEVLKAGERRRDMIEEVARLRVKLWRLEAVEEDYARLRKQVAFKQSAAQKLLLCEVVSRGDSSGWWQTVRLNRGREHGIESHMAVISIDGLVGRTTDVSERTCDVLLISDPNSRVACKFQRTGGFGILVGAGVAMQGDVRLSALSAVNPCVMNYVSMEEKAEAGVPVLTSGMGGIFPEGIPVGYVGRAEEDRSRLYWRTEVSPSADLSALKYVFVVLE